MICVIHLRSQNIKNSNALPITLESRGRTLILGDFALLDPAIDLLQM